MQKKSNEVFGNALILSLVLVVIDLIGGFAHLRFETWFKWLPSLILIAALIYFCRQYGKQQENGVTFGKVFGYGMKVTSVVVLVTVIYSFISLLLIFPEFKDQVIEHSRTDMEAKGTLTEDQIDQALNMTRKFFLPFAIVGAVIGTYLIGLVGSLLGAALTRKTEPNVFQNNP